MTIRLIQNPSATSSPLSAGICGNNNVFDIFTIKLGFWLPYIVLPVWRITTSFIFIRQHGREASISHFVYFLSYSSDLPRVTKMPKVPK